MSKQHLLAALLAGALLPAATHARARAQDGPPPLDPAQVPAEGATPRDFLPRGWEAGGSVAGDLNGDRVADQVLRLVPEGHETAGVAAAPERHALLILLSTAGGRLRRAGLATGLLVPHVPQYGLDLAIRGGVLVVNQNYGMTEVADLTHRFRYEPASGRFLLIGKDTLNYHRPQGPGWPSTRVSENYLTGVRLTTTERWLRNGKNSATTARARIARARVFLEDVNEDPDR